MVKRVRLTNVVSQVKGFAEAYLKQGQESRIIPKRFSGFTGAKVNGYVHLYQFDNNKLIGAILVHANNVGSLKNTLNNAANSVDLAGYTIKEPEEEVVIARDDTESE